MKAEINLKYQGIKGGDFKYLPNKGMGVIIIDSDENSIVVDAFSGAGKDYQRREKSLIEIKIGSKSFNGTIDDLKNKLFNESNTDEIDCNQKLINIKRIKDILVVWGSTSCTERECDHSPTINSIGNIAEQIETFYADSVEAIVYDDDVETQYNSYQYEDLSEEIINEILEIVDEYEADMLKTEKRCAD